MFIRLTRISRVLTEEAQKRLEEFEKKFLKDQKSEPTDSNGKTAKWYEDMNMPVPEELKKIGPESQITFEEKDYTKEESELLCNIKEVKYFDRGEEGTLVLFDNKAVLIVKENIEEIYTKINKLNRKP